MTMTVSGFQSENDHRRMTLLAMVVSGLGFYYLWSLSGDELRQIIQSCHARSTQ